MNVRAAVAKIASLSLVVCGGCSLLKASPAKDSGFLPYPDLLKPMPERAPFNAVYVPDTQRLEELRMRYRSISIMPINTQPAESRIRAQSLSARIEESRISDLHELSGYFHSRLKSAFSDYDGDGLSAEGVPIIVRKFTVLDEPTEETLVLEIAITEISPNLPEVSALATVAGFFLPGSGLIRLFGSGSVAIEGIVRDGRTGDMLAEFRDREADKSAPISVRDYQMYAHIRRSFDEWADQLAELAGTTATHRVKDSLPFTLNPL
jgi:hypothetical protein